MNNPSDDWDELRRQVLGLGDSSFRKTHYPSLRQRLAELERFRSKLQPVGGASDDVEFTISSGMCWRSPGDSCANKTSTYPWNWTRPSRPSWETVSNWSRCF